MRTMLDMTFGAGRKAVGGTSKSRPMRKRYCSITESRPYSSVPGSATMRITTSFCSMKVMSFTLSAKLARWNRIGVEMLYGRLPTMRKDAPPSAARLPKSNFNASPSCTVICAGV